MLTDGRTTDGRRTDVGVIGILMAHLRALGSGELKIGDGIFFKSKEVGQLSEVPKKLTEKWH